MMYNILSNPTVEKNLLNEIESFEYSILNYSNIKQLNYTQAVFYETLRLYPSVPKNGKVIRSLFKIIQIIMQID